MPDRVFTRILEETIVEGKRLGRHVEHDVLSFATEHLVADTTAPILGRAWTRRCPIFNQDEPKPLGSCTGNAAAGWEGTDNATRQGDAGMKEADAIGLYEAATHLDSISGSYPPDDTGSSGLAVAKALVAAGAASKYKHARSLHGALHVISTQSPILTGIPWYTSVDEPDAHANVTIARGATVRGGHELEVIGTSTATEPLALPDLDFVIPPASILLPQSWGDDWGHHGYFTMSWADYATCLDNQGDVTVPVS